VNADQGGVEDTDRRCRERRRLSDWGDAAEVTKKELAWCARETRSEGFWAIGSAGMSAMLA
jgi:hypothetical protein